MNKVYGYINALTLEVQNEQANKLNAYGVDEWVSEQVDGRLHRAAFDSLIDDRLRPGDQFVIYSVYHLPLTALQTIELIEAFQNEGIEFVSICEDLDLDTMCMLAKLHRFTIRQRAKGILSENVSKRGRKKGKVKQKHKEQGMAAAHLYKAQYLNDLISINEVLLQSGIKSKSTLYKRLRENGIDPIEEQKKKIKRLEQQHKNLTKK